MIAPRENGRNWKRKNPSVMTVGDISHLTEISHRTIQKLIDNGAIPGSFHVPGSKDRRVLTKSFYDFVKTHHLSLAPSVLFTMDPYREAPEHMQVARSLFELGLIVHDVALVRIAFDVSEEIARDIRERVESIFQKKKRRNKKIQEPHIEREMPEINVYSYRFPSIPIEHLSEDSAARWEKTAESWLEM